VKPDLPPEPGYEIELRWKEEVVYWESGHGYVLEAGWGVDPPVLYVPSAALWDDVVPAWLSGRRAEVLDRLVRRSGHVVKEATEQYGPGADRTVER